MTTTITRRVGTDATADATKRIVQQALGGVTQRLDSHAITQNIMKRITDRLLSDSASQATVAFSGTATLEINRRLALNRAIAFAGAGSLGITYRRTQLRSVAFSGAGSSTLDVRYALHRSAAFSGAGSLNVSYTKISTSGAFSNAFSTAFD